MAIDVEEQYDKIYRYCYFKLQDRSAAEDATQETFLRYFEHYPFLTSAAALKCLYTIARNLCVDEYRKARPLPLFGRYFLSWQAVPFLYVLCAAALALGGKRIYQHCQISGR